jgi:succinoglycan biosynthesis transport protein ExoP
MNPPAMNNSQHLPISPKEFIRVLAVRWRLWVLPALVISLGTAIFALTHNDTWEASQALIVRNEAANNEHGPGKFAQVEEMKTIQETLLEIARSRGVLEAALKQVGPPADCNDAENWPSDRDIEACRKAVKLLPPKGAEYGKTEVFYLAVRDHDRARATALNAAIYDRLQIRFQELRDAKAHSMMDELSKTVALAKADLAESTAHLSATEKHVGGDLAELRAMQDVGAGESALRRNAEEIRNQIREARATATETTELLAVLHAAQDDPGRLLAAPNRLLESQPALKRLKDGLLDAQIATAKLLGARTAEHPLVQAAQQSEEEIGRHLHDELALAVHGLKIESRLNADRQEILEDQLASTAERLNRLVEIRALYETQTAENRNRAALTERAEQNLAEARSVLAGAKVASLISRIDQPDTGAKPVGPGRAIIALGGILGGLIAGLGIVFLSLPATTPSHTVNATEENTAHENRSNASDVCDTIHNAAAKPNGSNGRGHLTFKKALEKIHLKA